MSIIGFITYYMLYHYNVTVTVFVDKTLIHVHAHVSFKPYCSFFKVRCIYNDIYLMISIKGAIIQFSSGLLCVTVDCVCFMVLCFVWLSVLEKITQVVLQSCAK